MKSYFNIFTKFTLQNQFLKSENYSRVSIHWLNLEVIKIQKQLTIQRNQECYKTEFIFQGIPHFINQDQITNLKVSL